MQKLRREGWSLTAERATARRAAQAIAAYTFGSARKRVLADSL